MHCLRARPTMPASIRSRGTVLVIDDDAWIRSLIADFLIDEGFRVELATDGRTGLRRAEQIQPDVILLDLARPMHSSLEVLQRFRERQPTRDIPIIVVSAYAKRLVRGRAAHAQHILRHPLDFKELLNQVNSLVKATLPKLRLLPPAS